MANALSRDQDIIDVSLRQLVSARDSLVEDGRMMRGELDKRTRSTGADDAIEVDWMAIC